MRRPIMPIFLAFLLGIVGQYFLTVPFTVLFLFLIVLFFLLTLTHCGFKHQKDSLFFLVLLVIFSFTCGALRLEIATGRDSDRGPDAVFGQEGKVCRVAGRVMSFQKTDDDYGKLVIKTEQAGKVLVYVKGQVASAHLRGSADLTGRNVAIKGVIELPVGARNPRGFNEKLYLKTKGIQLKLQAQAAHVKVIDSDMGKFGRINPFTNGLARLKQAYLKELQQVMDEPSLGLMSGMLFGDKAMLDDDLYEMFQKNGVAHILSVSGIHIGIIYLLVNQLLGNRRTVFFSGISLIILIAYAAISEFSPSVVRAVCMIGVHAVSKLTHRRYDLLCCTGCCALAMLIANPYALFGVGFQLSYLACFSLAVILPWMQRRIEFWEEDGYADGLIRFLRYLSPMVAIQIGMMPFTAYTFNYFSGISFFLNIPIIALAGVLIPIGIFLIPLSFLVGISCGGWPLGEVLFGFAATVAELLAHLMILINEKTFLPGLSFQNVVSPRDWLLLLFYFFLFFGLSEWFRILWQRQHRKKIVLLATVFTIAAILSPMLWIKDYDQAGIIFLDVGQGDCLVLRTPKEKCILVDGGGSQNYDVGKKTLLPFLLKHGVNHVDIAFVSHLHDDHFLGIASLAKELKIDKLGTYAANRFREEQILAKTGLKPENMLYLAQGQRVPIEEGIYVDILYPQAHSDEDYRALIEEETDENKSSLLMKISYFGLEILMTGDMGFAGEEAVSELYQEAMTNPLKVDVLKIGHHGSKYSTGDEFLATVSPRLAVFQMGKNNFGHPNKGVIEKCEKRGIMCYRNDQNGAIMLWKGKRWHIETMLPRSTPLKESTES